MNAHQIFYDADCPVCVREMALLSERACSEPVTAVPIQGNEDLLASYGISRADALTYIHMKTADGKILRGMDALRLMHRVSNGFFVFRLTGLPLLRPFFDWLYPIFARNRYRFPAWLLPHPRCENGACQISPKPQQDKKS